MEGPGQKSQGEILEVGLGHQDGLTSLLDIWPVVLNFYSIIRIEENMSWPILCPNNVSSK